MSKINLLEYFGESHSSPYHIQAIKRFYHKDNIDELSLGGLTPLMYASRNGYTEIAKVLIEQGADLEIRDKMESTALLWAISNYRAETAKVLLEAGADPNKADEFKRTPLVFTAVRQQKVDFDCAGLLTLLLKCGADPTIVSSLGRTALDEAKKVNNTIAVEILENFAKEQKLQKDIFEAKSENSFSM